MRFVIAILSKGVKCIKIYNSNYCFQAIKEMATLVNYTCKTDPLSCSADEITFSINKSLSFQPRGEREVGGGGGGGEAYISEACNWKYFSLWVTGRWTCNCN